MYCSSCKDRIWKSVAQKHYMFTKVEDKKWSEVYNNGVFCRKCAENICALLQGLNIKYVMVRKGEE